MLLQRNKMDLENNQEAERENAVQLPWTNPSLAPCCTGLPAVALRFRAARPSGTAAGVPAPRGPQRSRPWHGPCPLTWLGDLLRVLQRATSALAAVESIAT